MSDTDMSTSDLAAPQKHSETIHPIRLSGGVLLALEDQKWDSHPANMPYSGSANSQNNCTDVNEVKPKPNKPDSELQDVHMAADSQETRPLPKSDYPGAGPGGLPMEGRNGAWNDHPSHQLHQTRSLNHNDINIPVSTEAFVLGDDEKKIEEKIDTRTPNTTIFTFNKEDHTLANLLRDKLLKNSHVTFSAYRIPHPLFAKFELRIQTDGEITPKEALLATSRDIIQDLSVLKTNFTREYELRKMVGGTQNGQN